MLFQCLVTVVPSSGRSLRKRSSDGLQTVVAEYIECAVADSRQGWAFGVGLTAPYCKKERVMRTAAYGFMGTTYEERIKLRKLRNEGLGEHESPLPSPCHSLVSSRLFNEVLYKNLVLPAVSQPVALACRGALSVT